EKENNIRMRKLFSRPAIFKPDRFKKRVDVLLSTGADKPTERNLFARAISGQLLRRIARIEREQQHAKLSGIGGRAGHGSFELINVRNTCGRAASINRQKDYGKTREFRSSYELCSR